MRESAPLCPGTKNRCRKQVFLNPWRTLLFYRRQKTQKMVNEERKTRSKIRAVWFVFLVFFYFYLKMQISTISNLLMINVPHLGQIELIFVSLIQWIVILCST